MIKVQCLAFFSVYIRQCEFWMCTIVASPSFLPEENCNVFTQSPVSRPGTLDTDSHLVHCRAELSSHQWAETAGCRGAEVRVTAWGTSWGTWWRAASSLSWPHSASSATSPPSVCSETTGSRWRLHSGTIQRWLNNLNIICVDIKFECFGSPL